MLLPLLLGDAADVLLLLLVAPVIDVAVIDDANDDDPPFNGLGELVATGLWLLLLAPLVTKLLCW